MQKIRMVRFGCLLTGSLIVTLGWLVASPHPAYAQTAGQNAVYGPSGGSTLQVPSVSFVDANVYAIVNGITDICSAISGILAAYQSDNGIVIDARGFAPNSMGIYPCSGATANPWAILTIPSPNTVLLPAGTIQTSTTWILPSYTRLMGQGANLTTIKATFTGSDMIDMGSAGTTQNPGEYCAYSAPRSGNPPSNGSWYCQAVVVEHLRLDGNSAASVNGLVNNYSQELSYANDVALTNLTGTGLILGGNSQANCGIMGAYCVWGSSNSGPYTNIYYSGSGPCVRILGQQPVSNAVPKTPNVPVGLGETRGIHGLTCKTTATSGAAIYVDSPQNSLEDISISGASTPDGILIGSLSNAQSNTLFNISGTGLQHVIHISSHTYSSSGTGTPNNCQPGSSGPVNACDITIIGATGPGGTTTPTIYDELSNTSLTDSNVAMYILGEQLSGVVGVGGIVGGYSRFTTSPNLPTWSFGPSAISTGTTCPVVGALYSQTSGTGISTGSTVYGCQGQPSTPGHPMPPLWVPVPVH